MTLISFEIDPGADPDGIRRALATCQWPARVERPEEGRRTIVVDARDVGRAMAAWLRTGLGRPRSWGWPPPDEIAGDTVRTDGRWWHVARLSVRRPPAHVRAVLLLAPVDPSDVARALASTLAPSPWWPRRDGSPRPLARSGAAVLGGTDGVAHAYALALVPASSPGEARVIARSLGYGRARLGRGGADAAWRLVSEPSVGVWRLLSDLQGWWA